MEIYLIKTDKGHFLPAYESDKEGADKIKPGEMVRCKVTRPRNIGHHRKLWALLKLTLHNLPETLEEHFKSEEDLLDEIKLQVGLREKRITLGGKVYYKPGSINFLSMNQTEFEEFYSKSVDVILKWVLRGVDRPELESQLLDFM